MNRLHALVVTIFSAAFSCQAFSDTLVYNDGELTQRFSVASCSSNEGCDFKLSTNGSHRFVYNFGSFDQLDAWMTAFVMETNVYDANWSQPMEVDALIKVNGVVIGSEKFRKDCVSCKKRRRKDPRGTSTVVYSYAKAGDVVEVVFQPVTAPIDSSNFTLNIKRYSQDTLLSSQSRAWYPGSGNFDGDTSTIEN